MRSARSALVAIAVVPLACAKPRSEPAAETVVDTVPETGSLELGYPQLEEDKHPTEKVPVVPMPGAPPTLTQLLKPKAGAPWDTNAAKEALSSVPYKDCGTGGPGKVVVTFDPSGHASKVEVIGNFTPATSACIATRFRSARVPAFDADEKNVGWSIRL